MGQMGSSVPDGNQLPGMQALLHGLVSVPRYPTHGTKLKHASHLHAYRFSQATMPEAHQQALSGSAACMLSRAHWRLNPVAELVNFPLP